MFNVSENCENLGALYNFYTIDTQILCPDGWRVPSHQDFTTLELSVCDSNTCETDFPYTSPVSGVRGTNEGSKLAGTSRWSSGVLKSDPAFGLSLFDAIPSGYRVEDGTFFSLNNYTHFWTTTTSDTRAWYRRIRSSYAGISRHLGFKERGFSVRCLRVDF